jgi:hypothetical protein
LEGKFVNSKNNPKGQSSIEEDDRFHLDVFFPIEGNQQPIHMFFSKNWRVGKIIDIIAKEGGLENVNEIDKEKRYYLFNLLTGERLINSNLIKDEGNVKSYDPVFISKGLEIDKQIIEKFSLINKNKLSNEEDLKILDNCIIF